MPPPPVAASRRLDRSVDSSAGWRSISSHCVGTPWPTVRTALKQLQQLSLYNTAVTDAGLKELANLKQLSALYLSKTNVTEAGVAELREALPRCSITGP